MTQEFTQDEIIDMAVQAGIEVHGGKRQIRVGLDVLTGDDTTKQVVAFAKLVAAKERESLLQVVYGYAANLAWNEDFQADIKARGES